MTIKSLGLYKRTFTDSKRFWKREKSRTFFCVDDESKKGGKKKLVSFPMPNKVLTFVRPIHISTNCKCKDKEDT